MGWTSLDLQLLHHYSTCSCLQFAPNSALHRCWTVHVPELSFDHPYLLRQILAVAALHKYKSAKDSQSLRDAALSHRTTALELVKPVLSTTYAPVSAIAIFAFAGLTAICAYGELSIQLQDHGDAVDIVNQLIVCFSLNRGISTIVDAHKDQIAGGWAEDMISLRMNARHSRLQTRDLRLAHAEIMHNLIEKYVLDNKKRAVYVQVTDSCLDYIQILLSQQDHDDDIYFLIMAWPNEVDEVYMQDLDQRDPIALIVLAHYAVLMSLRPKLWWLSGWSDLLLRQLTSSLPTEFQLYLEWPRNMMEAANVRI